MSGINTPQLKKLWNDAQARPEWAATRFWEYVFVQIVFKDPMWSVASQQPPTRQDGDRRRVDLMAEDIMNNFTLLFVTERKTGIWAMTCVGTQVRLWAYQRKDDYLTPFWPLGDQLAAKNDYVDFSTHGQELLEKLVYIQRHPFPAGHIFEQSPRRRPTEVTLPSDWHDQEAKLILLENGALNIHPPVVPSQGTIIRAEACLEVGVEIVWEGQYMCIQPRDGKGLPMYVFKSGWVKCWIKVGNNMDEGYMYSDAEAGRTYYTWSLKPDTEKREG
ncbi:uncharacterized protein BBA_07572 [Beauveria bassiana ARSEF 2860]|uniref:Uncharacterized protein n=1 Tax=Beauveria bassiana (strain ARSEF 2860) TaxID=655819 RepID=J5JJ96_BEAB2|nr:uncharacterized protein BBA_07572 [Beauveria bassiana ARSEF 2860]EJP63396.1 hypothetical protein BBA_07572 [Beauveria bassiana ARSEF 2860]